MNFKLFVAVISISLLGVTAEAQNHGADREFVAKLEQMRDQSAQKAQNLTGGPKLKWLLHEARINKLIDQLKAGQAVDPKEIDALLKERYR